MARQFEWKRIHCDKLDKEWFGTFVAAVPGGLLYKQVENIDSTAIAMVFVPAACGADPEQIVNSYVEV